MSCGCVPNSNREKATILMAAVLSARQVGLVVEGTVVPMPLPTRVWFAHFLEQWAVGVEPSITVGRVLTLDESCKG